MNAAAKSGGRSVFVVLVVLVVVVAVPIVWTIRVALRPQEDFLGAPGSFLGEVTLDNFSEAWRSAHLGSGVINSLAIVPLGAFIATLVAGVAAFSLAKLQVPGRRLWLGMFVLAIAVPLPAIVIPLFDQAASLGYLDSHLGVSVTYGGLFLSWGTLFMYAYYQGLPKELIDGARIDGASGRQMLWHIGLPLGRPALVTAFVINVLIQWGELVISLVMLPDPAHQTLTVAVGTFNGQYRTGGPVLAAAALIAAIPVLAIFAMGQRFIRPELLAGALKE